MRVVTDEELNKRLKNKLPVLKEKLKSATGRELLVLQERINICEGILKGN